MPELTYTVARHAKGGWSVNVNGVLLRYPTKEAAVRSATLAAQGDRLHGDVGIIRVQQDDGSFTPEFVRIPGRLSAE